MAVISVLWHSGRLRSAEHCTLAEVDGGHRLRGTVLLPVGASPGWIAYRVEADERWRTRAVELAWSDAAATRRRSIVADGHGRWTVDGVAAPALDGCVDVDLGFSPCTNTLPIRRLAPAEGEAARILAAWVRFPGFTVEAGAQSYERLGERRWAYRSGAFAAELTVDAAGLVTAYGTGDDAVWTALAGPSPADAAAGVPLPGGR